VGFGKQRVPVVEQHQLFFAGRLRVLSRADFAGLHAARRVGGWRDDLTTAATTHRSDTGAYSARAAYSSADAGTGDAFTSITAFAATAGNNAGDTALHSAAGASARTDTSAHPQTCADAQGAACSYTNAETYADSRPYSQAQPQTAG
jgi:hypothetical protein